MRKFQCEDCQHMFELPYGQGGRGVDLNCPQCGSTKVFRSPNDPVDLVDRWAGRGAAMVSAWGRRMVGRGRGRGWRRDLERQQSNTEQKNGEQK